MSEELAYSIHLGSDKNQTTKEKEIANNIARRVTIPDENKNKKRNNDTRF